MTLSFFGSGPSTTSALNSAFWLTARAVNRSAAGRRQGGDTTSGRRSWPRCNDPPSPSASADPCRSVAPLRRVNGPPAPTRVPEGDGPARHHNTCWRNSEAVWSRRVIGIAALIRCLLGRESPQEASNRTTEGFGTPESHRQRGLV